MEITDEMMIKGRAVAESLVPKLMKFTTAQAMATS
jgi:hypothetical protein